VVEVLKVVVEVLKVEVEVLKVEVEVLKVLVCDIQVVQHFTRPHHTVICHVVNCY